jgi:hypothetical protein
MEKSFMQHQPTAKPIFLIFPNIFQLWAFAKTLSISNFQINATHNCLICECTESEVQRAIKEYDATILQQEGAKNG